MADFLDFIDANSQPNGRQSGSYSAQLFFHPKFTRIAPPKQGEKNYDEKARSSLVHEFNRVQGEMRKGTCGPTAASEWLKKHRPKVALHPSMTDYCDTCKSQKEELSRVQSITNRLQQSGNASESELRAQEERRQQLEERKQHKEDATKARVFYKDSVDKCKSSWSDIMQLTKKHPLTAGEENLESETLLHPHH